MIRPPLCQNFAYCWRFSDITTDRSLEKGETRTALTSEPLDDDLTLLVTGDFDVFIGGVTN